jgi:hypothetical protein
MCDIVVSDFPKSANDGKLLVSLYVAQTDTHTYTHTHTQIIFAMRLTNCVLKI